MTMGRIAISAVGMSRLLKGDEEVEWVSTGEGSFVDPPFRVFPYRGWVSFGSLLLRVFAVGCIVNVDCLALGLVSPIGVRA